MAKKPDLTEALRQASGRPAVSGPAAAPKPAPAMRPDRQGTKTIAGHFDPSAARQLKQLALDRDATVQELIREALNDLFAKHGLPPQA
jgi:ribonuclease PH